ncbi:PTS system mannose/fructose/N-acetylgalactosamine-transporter subunit IIB [candidate division KSB1 bacterium]
MPEGIVRIDDRLIHGQVIVGWGSFLNPEVIVVCNDEIADSDMEKELYSSTIPDSIEIIFLSVEQTAQLLKSDDLNNRKFILLMESPFDALRLLELGGNLSSINIGGLHFKNEAVQFLTYVYLNKDEISCFRKIMDMGVELECRDLPQSKKVLLKKLFNK